MKHLECPLRDCTAQVGAYTLCDAHAEAHKVWVLRRGASHPIGPRLHSIIADVLEDYTEIAVADQIGTTRHSISTIRRLGPHASVSPSARSLIEAWVDAGASMGDAPRRAVAA